MSKALTALKRIGDLNVDIGMYGHKVKEFKSYQIVEKELLKYDKIKKLVKEKNIDIVAFNVASNVTAYNNIVDNENKLTREEFMLLKGIFK